MIVLTGGNTYRIKDALKMAGWRWIEYCATGDILGVRERHAWGKRLLSREEVKSVNRDEVVERLRKIMAGLTSVTGQDVTLATDNSPLGVLGMQITGDTVRGEEGK
jgi:hypothetical protein